MSLVWTTRKLHGSFGEAGVLGIIGEFWNLESVELGGCGKYSCEMARTRSWAKPRPIPIRAGSVYRTYFYRTYWTAGSDRDYWTREACSIARKGGASRKRSQQPPPDPSRK